MHKKGCSPVRGHTIVHKRYLFAALRASSRFLWQLLHRSVRFSTSLPPPSHSARPWSTSPPMPAVYQRPSRYSAHTFPQSAHLPSCLPMALCLALRYALDEYSVRHGSRSALVASPSVGLRLGLGLHGQRWPSGCVRPQCGQYTLTARASRSLPWPWRPRPG